MGSLVSEKKNPGFRWWLASCSYMFVDVYMVTGDPLHNLTELHTT